MASKLFKHRTWSPDWERDEIWRRRRDAHRLRRRDGVVSRTVTDEDLDELRGCLDLGFGFDVGKEGNRRLTEVLPALNLYYDLQSHVAGGSPATARSSSGLCLYSPGDSPEEVKARLKQWAQVVACSVRRRYP